MRKKDPKFYSMLLRSSNLQHSPAYAQSYRSEDERSQNEISHAAKCNIIRDLSRSFDRMINVLDLGCGTGRYFHCLKNVRHCVAVDASENMLTMAKDPINQGNNNVQLVRGSLFDIQFKPQTFDLVICIGVFGASCPLDKYILSHISKFLNPHGIFFFTVPEHTPIIQTWKRRAAEAIEPFLVGHAKRLVNLRLRRFNVTEQCLRNLLRDSFNVKSISPWQSPTARIDLHCIVSNRVASQI